ncbi:MULTISPECIES: FYDLN acid domain-containing protein [unclassified Paracoccus (in: a-proteobacteria)]|uniref:FYDLN acid domain-containing protein n=1 Tax=unclassified Paracoccus (in: a-proteobacteria) TaxID=2688777 RepID=UPI0015FF96BA|nr:MULTISPECIES: FYDLN acid domain-containing protein [unclassified Paracoccus (in: a-proteobacteria)]MBB1491933.1 FYDLN acid domain-containing protein [Paracoccus sp. MC1854]MBB1498204.1 FYDLN acid domain-containing protein [Paracoccus sp. MC1862]QQO45697.1 FYDLN acid domain-containing protein [Paracoccus sp. MC1862]
MPKEEWGTKRLCPACGSRFYDLRNDPMTCPACSTEFSAESLMSARTRSLIAEKAAAREAETDEVIDDDLDDATDAGELDDDLLDEDDDADVSLDEIADVAEPDED